MLQCTLSNLATYPRRTTYSNGHRESSASWLVLDEQSHWAAPSVGDRINGFIWSKRSLTKPVEKLGLVLLHGVKRWTAIGTFADPYWNRVKQGTSLEAIPADTHFLIWEREAGDFGILLPLLSGDHVNSLQGEKGGVRLVAASGHKNSPGKRQALAYAATGPDVYGLVDQSLKAIAAQVKSFRLRAQKKVPAFVDYLGWCSWDAFYSEVDEAKFLSAIRSFQRGGVKPGFVILDDGWLQNRGDLLCGFDMNGKKFPNGLCSLVSKVKEQYGIKFFGIWHAFTGYWGGVDPGSRLGKKYDVLKSNGTIRPWAPVTKKDRLYLINPSQAERFFAEFHQKLKMSGVDLIKVDGQSALTEFTRPHYGRVSAMCSYQRALQSSAVRHFDGGLIHCMSNGLDVAYHLKQTLVWRNSDDFFPKKSSSAQQTHVHTNALNNLWTGTFALPDWDMFQSHHRWADFHAAARALSGGPIYVCDKPGRQNFQILHRLASVGGRVWRCDRPALPAPESIFADCRKEPVLLKIHNRSANIGLIGFFHCSELKKKLQGSYSPTDIPDLKGARFITRRYSDGAVTEMGANECAEVNLRRMGFEIITVSPVLGGWFAPLGRLDRYAGVTSLDAMSELSPGVFTIHLRESGSYLFWCSRDAVVHADKRGIASFKYLRKTRLLTVKMKAAGTISVTLAED
jgi:raffinose synthase